MQLKAGSGDHELDSVRTARINDQPIKLKPGVRSTIAHRADRAKVNDAFSGGHQSK
ncbi:hypothetical protein BW687_001545 [Pseudomonas graminis]|uniref:hypothetical protein n=1 Tax=Pseudomonas graminis TaxID=158627 RepID=UPI0023492DC6|nr:hypothetical protein [Pseudomonas graminis]MDC6378864.1 hypothetical protein [Pseudomonas graminis]